MLMALPSTTAECVSIVCQSRLQQAWHAGAYLFAPSSFGAPPIRRHGDSHANWAPDVLSRAYGNRGNARSRQGKLADALADYNTAISIAPWATEPVLNR